MTLPHTSEPVRVHAQPEDAAQAEPTGCCGGPAPDASGACCALDAEVKSTGGTGCGCAPKAESTPKRCC